MSVLLANEVFLLVFEIRYWRRGRRRVRTGFFGGCICVCVCIRERTARRLEVNAITELFQVTGFVGSWVPSFHSSFIKFIPGLYSSVMVPFGVCYVAVFGLSLLLLRWFGSLVPLTRSALLCL